MPFRSDIQGLRAVAVVLVLLSHSLSWPSGGFLGVDIFFVISGFLITGILLRDIERTGTVSFRAFYVRRFRRIVPAALAVIIVTAVVALVVWFPARALQTVLDGLWAAVFMSNWHFVVAGDDYFAAGTPSPLLHYWSLSVEEQFYAAWPLVVLGAWIISGRAGGRHRRVLAIGTATLIALSIAWAFWGASTDPMASYFDTGGRVWQLLAGAMLAMVKPSALPAVGRRVVGAIGIGVIVVSALVVREGAGLPVPWAVPIVVGAALIIWANAGTSRVGVLGNPVSQWLGKVSYSLYLWHFPIVIFTFSLWGDSLGMSVAALAATVIVSAASFRWIEEPWRRSRRPREEADRAGRVRRRVPNPVLGLGVVALFVVLAATALYGPTTAHNAKGLLFRVSTVMPERSVEVASPEERRIGVEEGVDLATWPATANEISTWVGASWAGGCLNSLSGRAALRWCGDPTTADVVVVGDSVAMSWFPAIDAAAERDGLETAGVGLEGCQLAGGLEFETSMGSKFSVACAQRQLEMIEEIAALDPDILVLTGHPGVLTRMNTDEASAARIWQRGFESMLSSLSAIDSIVILEANPRNRLLGECMIRPAAPSDCIGSVDQAHVLKVQAERSAASAFDNTHYVATRDWFCVDGLCPVVINGEFVSGDGLHLSVPGAQSLVTVVAERLQLSRLATDSQ